eukprot:TRINITY_DN21790_c0_g1_i1.p1 TRINITY_DN21790_c0_g1~~TRINITY_DN21790_c0_g1_i1.p1  ORF type:complete len:489 (+),score=56.37 TRINITY_DN21790_c0_g1_i1:39-1505(+)
MAARRKGKGVIVVLSSSSASSYSSELESEAVSESQEESSTASSRTSEDEYELSDEELDRESMDDDDDSEERTSDVDSICDRVAELLRGARDLQKLKLEECRAYLRKQGLRLSGTKEICIQRIKEHWRIKDGNGEKLYPRSSFVINCTGDVCTGDVVLFTQRVYEKFDVATRGGGANPIGKRTIAGRVVKESYGAAKQQHTFTVEILWSKGIKKLPPLFPLLVKGRNLYRLKTFRQRWNNEAERSKVLAEKHRRGAAARHVRTIKKARYANGDPKRQRHSRNPGAVPQRQRNREHKCATRTRKETNHRKALSTRQAKMKRTATPRAPKSSTRHVQHDTYPYGNGASTYCSIPDAPCNNYRPPQMQFHYSNSSTFQANDRNFHLYNYKVGSTSTAEGLSFLGPSRNPMAVPTLHDQTFNHNYISPAYANYGSQFGQSNFIPMANQVGFEGQFPCSTPGCRDLGSRGCVVTSCWRCCTRVRRKCQRHRIPG